MGANDVIKSIQDGTALVVTGPHIRWMERPEHEQLPSAKAVAFELRSLFLQYKHPRPGRFSASSLGECPRRVVFEYAGAPALPMDIEYMEMADHGTAAHQRWQREGLTMGYMTEAEVWAYDATLGLGGSMDAVLEDESIFEAKTVTPTKYRDVVMTRNAPLYQHLLQLNGYFLLTGRTWASLVYENRATGRFHEFRVQPDDALVLDVSRKLDSYRRYVADDVLPPQRPECEIRVGDVYHRCPFRKMCHKPATVSEASALPAGAHGQLPPTEIVLPDWAKEILAHLDELVGEQA